MRASRARVFDLAGIIGLSLAGVACENVNKLSEIQKVEGAPGIVGARMPRNAPPFLTDGQVQIIRRWIQLGAKNN